MTAAGGRCARVLIACFILAACREGSAFGELPALKIDPGRTSVSGLSAGGYMAGQFLVAHSKSVAGAGIIGAGPFGCAQSAAAEAFPYYPTALASNLAQSAGSCVFGGFSPSGALDSAGLLTMASRLADGGNIDALANLRTAKIYLSRGSDDWSVAPAVVEAAKAFYLAAGVPDSNIEFVMNERGGHAFITDDGPQACNTSGRPFVENCKYDQAGAILAFVYGPLNPKRTQQDANFSTFDQKRFGQSATLADEGVVYVPEACRTEGSCRVHVVFHGCDQSRASVGDAVIRGTRYADWAETNKIVVLFPQVAASVLNPGACWDWWGYTGPQFLTKDAPQIKAVQAMLERLAQR
jgi:hypothetical protein